MEQHISSKVGKINGKDKVLDLSARLHRAFVTDFANIHGIGGKDHAPNSTMEATICDFSKGTGEKSVSVKFRLEVEDICLLKTAITDACTGKLTGNNTSALQVACNNALQQLRQWYQIQPFQDDSRPIPEAWINQIGQSLAAALNASGKPSGPVFTYKREKNNPYQEQNGLVPISLIEISYSPYRPDGSESRNPWFIKIENFKAPLIRQANGATSHNSNQATDKKMAFINVSSENLLALMVSAERFIRLWEMHFGLPLLKEAYGAIAAQAAEKGPTQAPEMEAPNYPQEPPMQYPGYGCYQG